MPASASTWAPLHSPRTSLPLPASSFITATVGLVAAMAPARTRSSCAKPPAITYASKARRVSGSSDHQNSRASTPASRQASTVSTSEFVPGKTMTATFGSGIERLQGLRPRYGRLRERHVARLAADVDRFSARLADQDRLRSLRAADPFEGGATHVRHLDDETRRFSEQRGARRYPRCPLRGCVKSDPDSAIRVAAQAHLGDAGEQPSIGDIMRRADDALADTGDDGIDRGVRLGIVQRWQLGVFVSANSFQHRAAQLVCALPQEIKVLVRPGELHRDDLTHVVDPADARDDSRGRDRGAGRRLVVQADVAADKGQRFPRPVELEGRSRFCETVDTVDQLAIGDWILRVAVIETIGESDGARADGGDVARGLDDRVGSRLLRRDRTTARVAVDRKRDSRAPAALDDEHARICIAGRDDGRPAHEAVVMLDERAPAADVRVREHFKQRLAERLADCSGRIYSTVRICPTGMDS